jgi:EAL domain-containing protein (putative c-di-GMP-specific phosphodiesterase class I)
VGHGLRHLRGWPSLVAMAVLSCIAIGCGIAIVVSTSNQILAIVAALTALAVGQFFLALNGWANTSSMSDELQDFVQERRTADANLSETTVHTDIFDAEIAELKRRASRFEKDVADLKSTNRTQYDELTERYEATAAKTQTLQDNLAQRPSAAAASREHLNFMLQPIIDLTTNETAHYRARFNMIAPNGSEIEFEKLVANADRGGLRAGLDVHVVSQAIPLLRRLRTKNPGMKMFVPVGAATLMSDVSLNIITTALEGAGDISGGIVFEFSHDALGRLTENGIAGLAKVARKGATLAISEASVAGLDLSSLRKLGVRFIGINAASIESGYGIASTWNEFAQVARGLQFQIMLTDINNPVQAAASAQIARLVTGPYFAPARRVKFNAGVAARSDFSAAA